MKDYAIVFLQGKQYKIKPGDKITTDKLDLSVGSQINLDKVLLLRDGDTVKIGQPYLDNLSLTARVLENKQGPKIRVFKYKAKSRYRKTLGFRPQQTVLEINAFGATAAQAAPAPTPKAKATSTKTTRTKAASKPKSSQSAPRKTSAK